MIVLALAAAATALPTVQARATATIVSTRVAVVAGRVSAPAAQPPRVRPCERTEARCRLIVVDLP